MEKYVPDIYQKSIYTIDYGVLKDRGIKCLLFDLDNTLVPSCVKEVNRKLKDLFDDLKEQGFHIIIFSNNHKNRLKIFKDELNVDCCPNAAKPFPKKFLMIFSEYNYNETEVAIIGDQLYTDIAGGNNVGITTILVNPVSTKDYILTRINRVRERILMKKLRDKNLFVKGRYYD